MHEFTVIDSYSSTTNQYRLQQITHILFVQWLNKNVSHAFYTYIHRQKDFDDRKIYPKQYKFIGMNENGVSVCVLNNVV